MNTDYRFIQFASGWQAVVKEQDGNSAAAMNRSFDTWVNLGGRRGEEELAGRRLGVAWAIMKANNGES